MSREFSVTYYPYPQIDPKTGKVSDLFRPTIPIKVSYRNKMTTSFQALVDLDFLINLKEFFLERRKRKFASKFSAGGLSTSYPHYIFHYMKCRKYGLSYINLHYRDI